MGITASAQTPVLSNAATIADLKKQIAALEQQNAALKKLHPKAKSKGTTESPIPVTSLSNDGKMLDNGSVIVNGDSSQNPLRDFHLRNSAFLSNDLPVGDLKDLPMQPASLSYAHPNHGRDTFSTDLGLAWLPMHSNLPMPVSLGFGFDYHRNTATAGAQDLIEGGVIANAQLSPVSDQLSMEADFVYKDNRLLSTESYLGNLGFSYLIGSDNETGPSKNAEAIANQPSRYEAYYWTPLPLIPGGFRLTFNAGITGEGSASVAAGMSDGNQIYVTYGFKLQINPLCYYNYGFDDSSFAWFCRHIKWTTTGMGFSKLTASGSYDSTHSEWNGLLQSTLEIPLNLTSTHDVTKKTNDSNPKDDPLAPTLGLSYELGDDPFTNERHVNVLTVNFHVGF